MIVRLRWRILIPMLARWLVLLRRRFFATGRVMQCGVRRCSAVGQACVGPFSLARGVLVGPSAITRACAAGCLRVEHGVATWEGIVVHVHFVYDLSTRSPCSPSRMHMYMHATFALV